MEQKMELQKLYFLQLTDQSEPYIDKLLRFISKERRNTLRKFCNTIDSKLSLYGELTIRKIASQVLNLNNEDIVFGKGDYGKPFIVGYPKFHYNISNTRNALALVISTSEVGVDIEKIDKADLGIASRFFSKAEKSYIEQSEIDKDKCFFEIWTKKEAYIKYLGKGLSIPLNSFNTLSVRLPESIYTIQKQEYIISVCRAQQKEPDEIIELTEDEVRNWFLSFADGKT